MRPEGREPLPDKAGESTLLSRSGGEKGNDNLRVPEVERTRGALGGQDYMVIRGQGDNR